MKSRGISILNYTMVVAYTISLILLAGLTEVLLVSIKVAVPVGLANISIGLAETGFSVTVIAVSILTVITNMSGKRYFGIKAGEYLKFKRKKYTPGFYDNLVVIVLMGAMQYAALAAQATFAAAVMFLEIIILMVVQIRWGLGIAFFYYGKEKEIRAFFINELTSNMDIISNPKSRSAQVERATQAVNTRIDQLFTHTKHAASVRESTEIVQNLNILTYVFKMLLNPKHQSIWRNYETRLDYLLSSLLQDKEQREYALSALENLMDIIIETIHSDVQDKGIAKNCDFDNSRNQAYELISYAEPKILKSMFEQQIFYKLAIVKIYGIDSDTRKVARYSHYTQQFSQCVSSSKYTDEMKDMIIDSIVELAPMCFVDGKIQEAGFYACILVESLAKEGVTLPELGSIMTEKYFSNHENNDEKKQKSVGFFMLIEKNTFLMQALPDMSHLDDTEKNMAVSLAKLLGKDLNVK